jgi:lipopolysaccharide assembly outer membrane protein LptD (OstA)
MKVRRTLAEQTETLTGARMAQDSQTFPHMNVEPTQPLNVDASDQEFTYFEKKVATRFVQLLGGTERARRILEKMSNQTGTSIQDIANMIPDIKLQNVHNMSSLYNPSAVK